MAKGNKRRVLQYRNEYGLYFVFARRIFKHIAELKDLDEKRVEEFAIFYYIQKYVIGGNDIVITEIAKVATQLGFDYSVMQVSFAFRYFKEHDLVEYWGSRYHLGKCSFSMLKSYAYWLGYYLNNFHSVVENGNTILFNRTLEAKRKRKERLKKKKVKKT